MSSVVGLLSLLNSPCQITTVICRYEAVKHGLHLPIDTTSTAKLGTRAANAWTRYRQAVIFFHRLAIQCSIHFPTGPWQSTVSEQVNLRFMDTLEDSMQPQLQHHLMSRLQRVRSSEYAASNAAKRMQEFLDSPPTIRVINDPRFLSSHAWRFHWQARHFQLPSDLHRNNRCPCGQQRTTGHLTGVACTVRIPRVISRHNTVCKLILAAVNGSRSMRAVWEMRRPPVPGPDTIDLSDPLLRPDLTITNHASGDMLILDVCISTHMAVAYTDKITKYEERAEGLRRTRRCQVHTGAIVISPFGAVFPQSIDDMDRLALPPHKKAELWLRIIRSVMDDSAYLIGGDIDGHRSAYEARMTLLPPSGRFTPRPALPHHRLPISSRPHTAPHGDQYGTAPHTSN